MFQLAPDRKGRGGQHLPGNENSGLSSSFGPFREWSTVHFAFSVLGAELSFWEDLWTKRLPAALLADPHRRFLSRMKIQGPTWEKGQMNGPSPKPQLDPLTSWSWLMRWVSSILPLPLPPPPASGMCSFIVLISSLHRTRLWDVCWYP